MSNELKALTDAAQILYAAKLQTCHDTLAWAIVHHAAKHIDQQRAEVLGRAK